jgi:hypothetical protein
MNRCARNTAIVRSAPSLNVSRRWLPTTLSGTRTLDGLVVLTSADGFFQVMPLQLAVSERVVVAESFHLKPLMQATLSSERFQVLGLSRKAIRLWEGHRFALDPIDLSDDFPSTIEKALGSELTEPAPHRRLLRNGRRRPGDGAWVTVDAARRRDKDAERFFPGRRPRGDRADL